MSTWLIRVFGLLVLMPLTAYGCYSAVRDFVLPAQLDEVPVLQTQVIQYSDVGVPPRVHRKLVVNHDFSARKLTGLALRGYEMEGAQLFTYDEFGKPPELYLRVPGKQDEYVLLEFPYLTHHHKAAESSAAKVVMR